MPEALTVRSLTMCRRFVLALATLAVLAPSAHAADTILDRPTRPTTVAAGSGVVLYSAYDKASRQYSLMQISDHGDGSTPTRVPVPSSPAPFDADVGPTSSGHAFYVYERCESKDEASCDVYAFNPKTGREQRSKASDPKHGEHHATYWKGRLAFVRQYGDPDSEDSKQVVYQRPDPSSRRSTRLPGVPSRRCTRGHCEKVDGVYNDLELFGRRLAEAAFSNEPVAILGGPRPEFYSSDLTELRLVDVESGRSRQLSGRGSGEAGQTWSAVSFDRGRLYAYFACFGDSSGCGTKKAGAYRYDYVKDRWAISGSTEPLDGFAVGDDATYELAINQAGGCGPVDGADPGSARCELVRKQPNLTYTPTKAP